MYQFYVRELHLKLSVKNAKDSTSIVLVHSFSFATNTILFSLFPIIRSNYSTITKIDLALLVPSTMMTAATAATTTTTSASGPTTASWGTAKFYSCDALIHRLERNDPTLRDVIILPTKRFGSTELERLAGILLQQEKEENTAAAAAAAEDSSTTTRPEPVVRRHWRSLAASSHPVSHDALRQFGRAVAVSAGQLQSLAIGHDALGDDGLEALCQGLRGCNEHDEVIHNYHITDEANAALGAGLQCLDLSYKGLTRRALSSLFRALGRSDHLEVLNLSRNDFSEGSSAAAAVDPVAGKHGGDFDGTEDRSDGPWDEFFECPLFPRLDDLDLSACQLSGDGLMTLLAVLHPRPRTWRLSDNPLGVAGVGALLEHSSAAKGLLELHAARCGVGDASLALLVAATAAPPDVVTVVAHPWGDTLTRLDLSGNAITEEGATCLAQFLCHLTALTELHLAHNPLGGIGVTSIVEALRDRSTRNALSARLDVLDLSDTGCTAGAAASAIQDAGGARTLRLYDNGLGSEGFLAVAESLRGGHPILEALDLAGNAAGPAAVVHLLHRVAEPTPADGVPSSSALTALVVGGNGGGPAVEAAVARVREVHPALDVARDLVRL